MQFRNTTQNIVEPIDAVPIKLGIAIAAPSSKITSRYDWVDCLRGIGIVLVVLGHALGGMIDSSETNAAFTEPWFRPAFAMIYVFHMPLFFFLSGIFVSGRLQKNRQAFGTSLYRNIAIPYFLWAIVQVTVIWAAGSLVNNPVGNLPVRLIETLWAPPSQFWFLYGLFFMHAAAMAMKERASEPEFLILGFICASIAQLDNMPPVAEAILRMVPYYAIGVVFGPRLLQAKLRSSIGLTEWLVLLAASCAMAISLTNALAKDVPGIWPMDASGIVSDVNGFQNFFAAVLVIASIVILALRTGNRAPRWLLTIGQHTMPIFVFHIIFIAGVRIIGARFLGVIDANQLLGAMCLAGLVGPLVAFSILRRLHLSRITGLG